MVAEGAARELGQGRGEGALGRGRLVLVDVQPAAEALGARGIPEGGLVHDAAAPWRGWTR